MEITFDADSVSVTTNYGSSHINVSVESGAEHIAAQLPDDARLHEMDVDVVSKWLLENADHDDILEVIGLDTIYEFISHGSPDGDSPV